MAKLNVNNSSANNAGKAASKAASARLQSTFNNAPSQSRPGHQPLFGDVGVSGTASSAGNHDRLVGSGTKGPGSDPRG
jgi:hypothetical protein